MKRKKDKKVLKPLIFGISFFAILVISASYAYFSVQTSIVSVTTLVNANAEDLGVVSLVGTNAVLNLSLTLANMNENNSDITYWATSNGTPSTSQNNITVGTTSVSPSTNTNSFNCSYTIDVSDVTSNGVTNMYNTFQSAGYSSSKSANQIVLTVGNQTLDFNTMNLFINNSEIEGTLNNVSYSNPQSITASFKVVNKSNINQSLLAGTGISIQIEVSSFSCSIISS